MDIYIKNILHFIIVDNTRYIYIIYNVHLFEFSTKKYSILLRGKVVYKI